MGGQWHTGAAGIGIEATINCNVDKCIDYAIRTYEFKIVLIFVDFELIYLKFKQICLQFELREGSKKKYSLLVGPGYKGLGPPLP